MQTEPSISTFQECSPAGRHEYGRGGYHSSLPHPPAFIHFILKFPLPTSPSLFPHLVSFYLGESKSRLSCGKDLVHPLLRSSTWKSLGSGAHGTVRLPNSVTSFTLPLLPLGNKLMTVSVLSLRSKRLLFFKESDGGG